MNTEHLELLQLEQTFLIKKSVQLQIIKIMEMNLKLLIFWVPVPSQNWEFLNMIFKFLDKEKK